MTLGAISESIQTRKYLSIESAGTTKFSQNPKKQEIMIQIFFYICYVYFID